MTNPFETPVRKVRWSNREREWWELWDANNKTIVCGIDSEDQADYTALALNNIEPCVEALRDLMDMQDSSLCRDYASPGGEGDRKAWRAALKRGRALLKRIDAEKKGD